jgi:hypothetical protein
MEAQISVCADAIETGKASWRPSFITCLGIMICALNTWFE